MIDKEKITEVFILSESADGVDDFVWKLKDYVLKFEVLLRICKVI